MADEQRALVPRERFARDHASARPGEVVAIDAKGEVISPAKVRRAEAIGAVAGVGIGLGAVAVASIVTGTAGLFVLGVALIGAGLALRGTVGVPVRVFKRVNALLLGGQRDAARAALATVRPQRIKIMEASRLALDGAIASSFGEHAIAIDRYDRALGLMPSDRHRVFRDTLHMSAAWSHAALGDLDAARRRRAQVAGGIDTPLYVLGLASAELAIAFAAGSPDDLPPDTELHDWAKIALEFHHSASVLVALAWAFAARGDHDMARHLLDNVDDRSDAPYLADVHPALVAWRTRYGAEAS